MLLWRQCPATPSVFREENFRLELRHNQATLVADVEKLAKDSLEICFTRSMDNEIIDPCFEVLIQFEEALFDLLLEVCCRVTTALGCACRNDDAIRRREGEERLAVWMEWSLPISDAEVNARKNFEQRVLVSSASMFCMGQKVDLET